MGWRAGLEEWKGGKTREVGLSAGRFARRTAAPDGAIAHPPVDPRPDIAEKFPRRLATEAGHNIGQRLARQALAHRLFRLDHHGMDRADAIGRPFRRISAENRTTPTPQVMPRTPGALYIHNNSRTLLTRLAEWGDIDGLPDGFAPQDCWALRRGQGHALVTPGMDVVCAHVSHPEEPYLCEPVLAGGEVIGLLYLKGFIGAEESFRLTVLMENIALALVNHQLQRGLREQSIRDPLTNLFNRRYMEETLEVEIARATRSGAPLSVVMCDVDHFKRFNDTFGHEAGDVLLRAVSTLIQTHFRNGDVACRYGGEEFAIIAPCAEMDHLARRAERLGTAIRDLAVHHAGQPLGQVTMSFGIASMMAGVIQDSGTLIRTADAALYQAKHLGRDRVVLADQPMLPLAAE